MTVMASGVLRFVLYLVACWAVIVTVAWGAIPEMPVLAPMAVMMIGAYVTAPLLAFVRRRGAWRRYPSARFRLFVVRPALYAQLMLPIVALAGSLGVVAGAFVGAPRAGGQLAMLIALSGCAALLVAGWIGSRSLRVREVEARVPGLPDAFDGFRIAQVSDLHLGPHTSRRFLDRVTRAVDALRADAVVVTGDLIDDRAEDTALFTRWLSRLADTPHGTYLIPGNHDVYAGWPEVLAELRASSRAHTLVNESQTLTRGGAVLALVGTGDPAGAHAGRGVSSTRATHRVSGSAAPDIERAFGSVPRGATTIVFAHNPALWPAIAARGGAVTLSGHTHWGQLAIPWRAWSLASPFLEFAMGGYQRGDALLYVHPGTGFWGIPFRLGALPEVTRVTLRRAPAAALVVGAPARAA